MINYCYKLNSPQEGMCQVNKIVAFFFSLGYVILDPYILNEIDHFDKVHMT